MNTNNSPWLLQLKRTTPYSTAVGDVSSDVAIIGGGIAGVTTLYYLLKHTDKTVVLLEGKRLAHRATGHNAGYVVAALEKPLADIARQHGDEVTAHSLRMVEGAWKQLDEIIADTGMHIAIGNPNGYGGFAGFEQFLADLENHSYSARYGISAEPVLVAAESNWMERIPSEYAHLCTAIPQADLLAKLSITDTHYCAAIPQRNAVMNSALFTDLLAQWCVEHYPDRARIHEHSFVHGIELESTQPKILLDQATIVCNEVVMCTNGFENFYIHDATGNTIDTKFHHMVHGAVGYMTGFTSNDPLPYRANYYYEPGARAGNNPLMSDPYFYVSQRPFTSPEHTGGLLAVGGPEVRLEDRDIYFSDFNVAEKFHDESVEFIRRNFATEHLTERFFWHGLMGYTTSGVRLVGREPLDPRLLYNLGCNGIGIMPSIMGALKIAKHINGEAMETTIFDPER